MLHDDSAKYQFKPLQGSLSIAGRKTSVVNTCSNVLFNIAP